MSIIQSERALLGACLQDPNRTLFECAKHGMSAESFLDGDNKKIYDAIQDTAKAGRGVDIVTVGATLKANGVKLNDPASLTLCIDACVTTAHMEFYAAEVKKEATRRNAKSSLGDVVEILSDETQSPNEVLENLQVEISHLIAKDNIEIKQIKDFKEEVITQLRAAKGKGFIGIPSCFKGVNQRWGGYRRQVVSYLGGWKGTGKSTFQRTEGLFQAGEGFNVGLLTMEDPGEQASKNLVGAQVSCNVFNLDCGYGTDNQLDRMESGFDEMGEIPIYMVDSILSIDQIEAIAQLMKSRYALDILYVDHAQLIHPYQMKGMNRNDTMACYSSRLASLAKRLDIHINCASQLSNAHQTNGRKPNLSDLRDSGALGQDARQVALLYPEEGSGYFTWENVKNNNGKQGGTVRMNRVDGQQRFEQVVSTCEGKTKWPEDGEELIPTPPDCEF